MKRVLFVSILFLLPAMLMAQAAGNYFFNQSKGKVAYDDMRMYDDAYRSEQYYQTNNPGGTNTYAWSWSNQYADSVMELSSSVMINVTPDAWVMILGLTQVGENLEETHQKINQRIDDLKNALSGDMSEDAFVVDFISQSPIFGMEVEKKLFSKNYVEVPVGFEVKKNVHIRFTNVEMAEEIIMKAAKYEIYDIIKVEPLIADRQALYNELRQECVSVINAKKGGLDALGMSLSPLFNSLDEKVFCMYPIHHYQTYQSYLDHTRQRLRGDERLIPSTGSVNLFYSKPNDSEYDKVLHPLMNGPVLQFTMHMRLLYTMSRSNQ